jgi:N-acetyl-gamma-glutamyl-phosphate reductase
VTGLARASRVATLESSASHPFWILGAGGPLAGEFLRLASGHPRLRLAGAATRQAGGELALLQPHLALSRATIDFAAAATELEGCLAEHPDADARPIAVLALPHGEAAKVWRELRARLGARAQELCVVDLSADYRLRDAADYERWYGSAHPDAEELAHFVYALPELARGRLLGARRLAAPGCFATALQLACLPAALAGILAARETWFLSAITGSSGSGAQPQSGTHHPHRHGNLWAYSLAGHRHEAELLQTLRELGSGALEPRLCFVPHSGPFVRGIHLTCVLPLARTLSSAEAGSVYREFYCDAAFVEVLPTPPDLRRVAGSNRAALCAATRGDRLLVVLTLDNTVKGGAGQALQALNLTLGLPEEFGLSRAGLGVL